MISRPRPQSLLSSWRAAANLFTSATCHCWELPTILVSNLVRFESLRILRGGALLRTRNCAILCSLALFCMFLHPATFRAALGSAQRLYSQNYISFLPWLWQAPRPSRKNVLFAVLGKQKEP